MRSVKPFTRALDDHDSAGAGDARSSFLAWHTDRQVGKAIAVEVGLGNAAAAAVRAQFFPESQRLSANILRVVACVHSPGWFSEVNLFTRIGQHLLLGQAE